MGLDATFTRPRGTCLKHPDNGKLDRGFAKDSSDPKDAKRQSRQPCFARHAGFADVAAHSTSVRAMWLFSERACRGFCKAEPGDASIRREQDRRLAR